MRVVRNTSWLLIFTIAVLLAGAVKPSWAQEDTVGQDAAVASGDSAQGAEQTTPNIPDYNPRDFVPLSSMMQDGSIRATDEVVFQSLLFTPLEVQTIVGTLNRSGKGALTLKNAQGVGDVGGPLVIPGQEADEKAAAAAAKPYYPPIPTKRIISLSGMVYRSPKDWIIWLNGHKLTPGMRLPELVDIKVESDRVRLKWFDIGMAKIIAITLRPRQTYDITSGVLLTSSQAEGQ